MASLESVLANIPGYGGYAARNQQKREEEFQDVKAVGALQQILEGKRKAQAAAQEAAILKQYRDEVAAAEGDEERTAAAAFKAMGPAGAAKQYELSQTREQNKQKFLAEERGRAERHRSDIQFKYDDMMRKAVTDEERNAIEKKRHQEMIEWRDRHDKVLKEIAGIRSAEQNRPLTEAAKLNEDLAKGRITKEQYDASMRQKIGLTGATDEVVKAIAEGRMSMPTGFALRSPYWQDVIERVASLDPNFDASRFTARAAARRTFASGPEARNVTALNTVIGHLGTLDEAAQALENKDLRVANVVLNRVRTELGDPRVQNFDTAKQAVAEETMRVFRQVGASEAEARAWGERIISSGSPSQLRGVIRTLGELLESRVEAIGQQYERTLDVNQNPARIDPKNREKLDRLQGDPGQDAPVRIKSDGEYEALKPGTLFIGPDGVRRRKP